MLNRKKEKELAVNNRKGMGGTIRQWHYPTLSGFQNLTGLKHRGKMQHSPQ
jgi:hypothetical protein